MAAPPPQSSSSSSRSRRLYIPHTIATRGGDVIFELPPRYSRPTSVLGSGAQGVVVVSKNLLTGEEVAIKKLLRPFQTELIARRAYREFALMRRLPPHANIIRLLDAFTSASSYDSFENCYIVMELMDFDLSTSFRKGGVEVHHEQLSFLLYQLLCAVNHLHRMNIIHRDLKPGNIVVKNSGCELKLLDFGLARCQNPQMSPYVFTRWYRAPEVILEMSAYSDKADIWAVGCIFAEMIKRDIYLPGRDHVDQWMRIAAKFGMPDEAFMSRLRPEVRNFIVRKTPPSIPLSFEAQFPDQVFPPVSMEHPDTLNSAQARDILTKMLAIDPEVRPTAMEALSHPYVSLWYNAEEVNGDLGPVDYDVMETESESSIEHWRRRLWDDVVSYMAENIS